jgi:FkbM family methyltransferase
MIYAYSTINVAVANTPRQFFLRKQSSDEDVVRDVFSRRQYDLAHLPRFEELRSFVQRKEANGGRPLIVDAGANIGASSVYLMASQPKAHVVAIEPNQGNFQLLAKNVEGLNVEAVHGALSSSSGSARVIDPGHGHWGYRTEAADGGQHTAETVPRLTVNDIYKKHERSSFPYLVKIDIEGGERDLFSANTEWVEQTPLIVIELHDWLMPKGGTSTPFLKCVSKLDRDFIYNGTNMNIYSIANDLKEISRRR